MSEGAWRHGGAPRVVRDDFRMRTTRIEQALDWAQSLAPAPMRLATACCGMAMVSGGDPFEALGAGPPAVSARAADLLIVSGAITRRVAPLVEAVYARMLEPRWVVAWGSCAISGGAYRNYATIDGLARVVPVDLVVPGCPPPVTALRDVLTAMREGKVRGRGPDLLESRDPAEWPILRAAPATEIVENVGVGARPGPSPDQNEGSPDVDLG